MQPRSRWMPTPSLAPPLASSPRIYLGWELGAEHIATKMRTARVSFLLGLLLPLCALADDSGVKVPQHGAQKQGECPGERHYVPAHEPEIKHNICQHDDSKCSGNMKCCADNGHMMCKPPAQERTGECPTFDPAPNPNARCNDNCTSDSECPKNWKCCSKSCGKSCVPPKGDAAASSTANTERKGFCQQEALYQCGSEERSFCDESSCIDGYKCCPMICRKQCRPTIPERDGTCPAAAECPSDDEKNCSTDYDCTTFHKCCSTKCGSRCLRVTNVHMNIHFPNNKPVV